MAMTKKEQAEFEALRALCSLHVTETAPGPDLPPPQFGSQEMTKGWDMYPGSLVKVGCSTAYSHGSGQTDKANSQNPRALYSTRLRALRALRNTVEREVAARLSRIDAEIAKELENPTSLSEGSN
jgi:hypothetical protein